MTDKTYPTRYRLHWPTWLVLACAAVALVYRQSVWQVFVGEQPGTFIYRCGWPLVYREFCDFLTKPEGSEAEYFELAIIVDLVTSLIVLVSPVLVMERLLRRKKRRFQMGLQTLFALVGTIAVMLGVWRLKPELFDVPVPFTLTPPVNPAWTVWCSRLTMIALIFGVACTVYMTGRFGCWILNKCFAITYDQRTA